MQIPVKYTLPYFKQTAQTCSTYGPCEIKIIKDKRKYG